jgi:preprotein translocase subunit SecF
VGPKVGQQLKTSAMLSLFLSILLIMIYIWLRFDLRFAPGATVAMVHDLVMVAGYYFLSGAEFTITSIAVLLTVAGYSVNDTIVVYDRVREIFKKGVTSGEMLPNTINRAINQTLSRTVLTSFVTLISVVPIAILCQGELKNFAIGMGIGIFAGTYSTVYIASPMTIYVEKFQNYRAKKKGGMPAPRKVSV